MRMIQIDVLLDAHNVVDDARVHADIVVRRSIVITSAKSTTSGAGSQPAHEQLKTKRYVSFSCVLKMCRQGSILLDHSQETRKIM